VTAARDAAPRRGLRGIEGRAVYDLARAVTAQGDTGRALELYLESAQLAEAAQDTWLMASNKQMAAIIHMDRGDLKKAQPLFESSIALYRKMGDPASEATGLLNLASLLGKTGDRRLAVEAVARANSLNLELKNEESAAVGLSFAGTMRIRMGDLEGAAAAWQQALELAKDPDAIMDIERSLADLRVIQADFAGARAHLARARAAPAKQPRTELTVRVVEAELALAEGRFADVDHEARDTALRFEAMDLATAAAACEVMRAEALWRQGRLTDARQVSGHAEKLLTATTDELDRVRAKIIAAALDGAASPARLDASLSALRQTADFSARHGQVEDAWRARLFAGELQLQARRPGARAGLAAMARDARAEGFELYARKAEALAR
jgi:tetratricopeptide (TPR) repeat protein